MAALGCAKMRAVAAAMVGFCTAAKAIIAAFNHQMLAVDQSIGNFGAGVFVDFSGSGSGNFHNGGTLLVGLFFKIHQSHHFKLIHGKHGPFTGFIAFGQKCVKCRFLTDPSAALRPCHKIPPLRIGFNEYSAGFCEKSTVIIIAQIGQNHKYFFCTALKKQGTICLLT